LLLFGGISSSKYGREIISDRILQSANLIFIGPVEILVHSNQERALFMMAQFIIKVEVLRD
jgi:hypothetical protein